MTDSQNDDAMYENLSARLDEIFGSDDEGSEVDESSGGSQEPSPLQGLNAVVLTLEWEITDDVVRQLLDQIERLKGTYKDDYFAFSLLRLLSSVGKYVQSKRADAHPSALNLLNSLHSNLVKVVESGDLSKKEKSSLLQGEVKKFKQLKQIISDQKSPPSSQKAASPQAEPEPSEVKESSFGTRLESEPSGSAPGDSAAAELQENATISAEIEQIKPEDPDRKLEEAIASAVEEIKEAIRKEFQALREEIETWKRER